MLSYNSLQALGLQASWSQQGEVQREAGAGPLLWRLNSHQHTCISFLCGPRYRGNGVLLGILGSSQHALTLFMVLAGLPCTAFCDPMGPRPFGSPVPSLGVKCLSPPPRLFKFLLGCLPSFCPRTSSAWNQLQLNTWIQIIVQAPLCPALPLPFPEIQLCGQ